MLNLITQSVSNPTLPSPTPINLPSAALPDFSFSFWERIYYPIAMILYAGWPYVILFVAIFIIWIWALVDVIKRQFNDKYGKVGWLLIVLFIPLGALLYLIMGRKQGSINLR